MKLTFKELFGSNSYEKLIKIRMTKQTQLSTVHRAAVLPGGGPLVGVARAVQQRAHVRLAAPRDVDHQHSCNSNVITTGLHTLASLISS